MDEDVAGVPEDEWHWSSWLGDGLLGVIPGVAVSVDTAGSVSIDVNAFSADDEARTMVLEGNRIGVVSPVVEII